MWELGLAQHAEGHELPDVTAVSVFSQFRYKEPSIMADLHFLLVSNNIKMKASQWLQCAKHSASTQIWGGNSLPWPFLASSGTALSKVHSTFSLARHRWDFPAVCSFYEVSARKSCVAWHLHLPDWTSALSPGVGKCLELSTMCWLN